MCSLWLCTVCGVLRETTVHCVRCVVNLVTNAVTDRKALVLMSVLCLVLCVWHNHGASRTHPAAQVVALVNWFPTHMSNNMVLKYEVTRGKYLKTLSESIISHECIWVMITRPPLHLVMLVRNAHNLRWGWLELVILLCPVSLTLYSSGELYLYVKVTTRLTPSHDLLTECRSWSSRLMMLVVSVSFTSAKP